jgi:DHA1 family bicyclomycin/chloramphenicol resistance-like MFS transporter
MLAWAGMKLSLPALPSLKEVFHVSGNAIRTRTRTRISTRISISITSFFFCFGVGQFFWGILSDRFGRRWPLMAGLVLTAIGSVVALVSESLLVYALGRCLEGLGLSAISPIARAVLFETQSHDNARTILGRISMCTAAIPLIAQLAGGYLVVYAEWRWIFALFLVATLVIPGCVFFSFPETHLRSERNNVRSTVWNTVGDIIRNGRFWANASCYMACSGSLLGYYAAMPFWYTKDLQVPTQVYPWLAIFAVASYILGLTLSKRFGPRIGSIRMIWIGIAIGASPGVILMGLWPVEFTDTQTMIVLVAASMAIALGAGLVFPGANAGTIALFPHNRAIVSSITLTGVFISAGIMASVEGQLHATDIGLLGVVIVVPPLLAISIGEIFGRSPKRLLS